MLTEKENLLETLKKDGKPDRLVNQYEAFAVIMNDPIYRFTRGNRKKGTVSRDVWGTEIVWPENQPAATPHITEETKVIKDITRWRDYVSVPDLLSRCTDWEAAKAAAAAVDRDRQLLTCFMGTGVFEQCHFLMGFEDALMSLLLEPESMHELIDVIGEYRYTYAKLLIENLHPDAIISHDDWGDHDHLFMQPDIWREFFKPQYERIYGLMKDNGVMIVHHADSFLEPIVEDMAELGIDIWQGTLPSNNIPELQRKLAGWMTLMGGVDSLIDRPDSTEEAIRREARRVCESYGPGGHFIPSVTYGLSGTIYPHVYDILTDEIAAYNAEKS